MILPLFQVLITVMMLCYAGYWRKRQVNRRNANWDEIVARLSPNDWGFDDVAERYLFGEGIRATPQDIWNRIHGTRGLWAMYRNAPILVQLADYAAEHGEGVSQELLEGLRTDAFQIRVCVMMALAQHVLRSSIGASVNAHRATATYSILLARITGLFQEHSALLFPDFLQAM